MSETPPIRIATRSSRLALWQAHHVQQLLSAAAPSTPIEIVHVSTIGDRDKSEPLSSLGEFGVFTREVQKVVLDGDADVAVHSLKDLPTETVAGLTLGAIPPRGAVHDVLLLPASRRGGNLDDLPDGAVVGTGSMRRRAQLLHQRPDFKFAEARGNVETRLRKLDEGEFDALILAAAGLMRLELAERIDCELQPPVMLPAIGQGALGIECRSDDVVAQELLAKINDSATQKATTAERSLLHELRGGCHAPIAAATSLQNDLLELTAVVLSSDGQQRLTATATGEDAAALGIAVAGDLRAQGADALITAAEF